ncbi:hypothetical protein EDC04DRAFT_2609071 [Pisolithus marmoratus]|nr:hypothetical protein EDC04DRAFT_2609071 [Pisolithus marmoratus]
MHWHYEATPSTTQSSSLQQPSHGGKQTTQKQSRAARVQASAGPSQVPSPQRSASGEAKWEEPVIPDILRPHSVFNSAWRKAEKNMQRVQLGLMVNPGYHFPKPILFVNVTMPEWKKTYLVSWLSACLLWISQFETFWGKILFMQLRVQQEHQKKSSGLSIFPFGSTSLAHLLHSVGTI